MTVLDQPIRFLSTTTNTGPAKIQTGTKLVTVKKNSVPLQTGDVKPNQTLVVDKDTGELIEVLP